jgi:hypothetical protein
MTKKLLLLLVFTALTGCAALKHQETYQQAAPTQYPKTDKVVVFEYRDLNIREIYDLLFSDYLIIGRSEFTGPYESPKGSVEFAKSIGTDVFVSTSQYKDSQSSYSTTSTPTFSTSYINGYNRNGPFYGTATSVGTSYTTIPVSFTRFDQGGLYLKNVNHVSPLWERRRSDYKESTTHPLTGIWFNDNFDLKLFKSGSQMAGFFNSAPKGKETGQIDDLKMLFNPETGVGIYMMADKTPHPAQIKMNKFGHLEVKLESRNESYSFARR